MSGMWEDEVARPDLRTGHRDPVVDLLISGAVQMDTRLRIRPLDQPGTVELIGASCAPDIGATQSDRKSVV